MAVDKSRGKGKKSGVPKEKKSGEQGMEEKIKDALFLLSEYQSHQTTVQYSFTLSVTLLAYLMAIIGIGVAVGGINPSFDLVSFLGLPLILITIGILVNIYFGARSYFKSREIRKRLRIDERLKRYMKKK